MRDEEEVYSFSHRLAYLVDRQVLPKKKAKRALSMLMRGQVGEQEEEEEEEEVEEEEEEEEERSRIRYGPYLMSQGTSGDIRYGPYLIRLRSGEDLPT